MNYLKFSIFFVIAFLFCLVGGYAIVTTYYQSFIDDYGYTFGLGVSNGLLILGSFIGIFIFANSCKYLKNTKESIRWLLCSILVFAPIIYFSVSPLSKEDRVYKEALNNYGSNFQVIKAEYKNKMNNHPDYIQYKYHFDNFEKDKESRSAYVTELNNRVLKYKQYLESQRAVKLNLFPTYYVYGSDYNTFVFRYKGIKDAQVQKELYDITKSGVVSYNDMMDFQVKFVDNYKNNNK
jgi:hypothetical protein